jgi:hypothetical protein
MRACTLAILLVVCQGLFVELRPSAEQTATASQAAPVSFPIRRVVLYKTGVGYFEHQGQVRNRQEIIIRFTSRQLNDVLKSLTTIDPKGQISGISYNSVAPMDQRLGALRLPLGANSTATDVLTSLRGAHVEVTTSGVPVQGRLLGVERKSHTRAGVQREVQELSVLTESGAVRSFELSPSVAVRVIEREMRQEIGRYLDVIGSTRERDVRNMVITTTGAGERPLFVSYISEVPVWKSTYRLLIPASGSPFLQGWAIVDNTIGEDWTNVELSLVAGAPQSFIQQISQPYYTRRPVVPLPANVLDSPQTHDPALVTGTANSVVAAMPSEEVPPPPPPPGTFGVGVGRAMGGTVGGMVGGLPAASAPFEQLRVVQPSAIPSDLGDLFQYRIKEPVTLLKNQSALVPIVNAGIGAEKVSLWNRGATSGHPLRAVWLSNTTGLTLDGGSITVIDGNAFAGEGLVEPLAQSATRLVSYATDLGIIVTGRLQTTNPRVSNVRARDGTLIQETQERATWSYAVRNEEASPATLVVEQSGVRVAAVMAALKPVLDKKAELTGLEKAVADLTNEQSSIVSDQQRLRENMKALRGTA